VRIWLLARAEKQTDGYSALAKSGDPNFKYVVGSQFFKPVQNVVNPANEIPDNLKARLMARTIECRNLGI
jgi:hypothetical protein